MGAVFLAEGLTKKVRNSFFYQEIPEPCEQMILSFIGGTLRFVKKNPEMTTKNP
jgi:hypothetical protein